MKITIEQEGKDPVVYDKITSLSLSGTRIEGGMQTQDFRYWSDVNETIVKNAWFLAKDLGRKLWH